MEDFSHYCSRSRNEIVLDKVIVFEFLISMTAWVNCYIIVPTGPFSASFTILMQSLKNNFAKLSLIFPQLWKKKEEIIGARFYLEK